MDRLRQCVILHGSLRAIRDDSEVGMASYYCTSCGIIVSIEQSPRLERHHDVMRRPVDPRAPVSVIEIVSP